MLTQSNNTRRALDPIGKKWFGPRTRLIADPWRRFAMNIIEPEESVAILGSGLTAVDAVLSLTQSPRSGAITLVSRNGLLPQAYSAAPVAADDLQLMVSRLLFSSKILIYLDNVNHVDNLSVLRF